MVRIVNNSLFIRSLSEKSNFSIWQVVGRAVPQPISGWVADNALQYRFILFCRELHSLTLVRWRGCCMSPEFEEVISSTDEFPFAFSF